MRCLCFCVFGCSASRGADSHFKIFGVARVPGFVLRAEGQTVTLIFSVLHEQSVLFSALVGEMIQLCCSGSLVPELKMYPPIWHLRGAGGETVHPNCHRKWSFGCFLGGVGGTSGRLNPRDIKVGYSSSLGLLLGGSFGWP